MVGPHELENNSSVERYSGTTCAIARFDQPEVIQVIKFPLPTPKLASDMLAKPVTWRTKTAIELSIFNIDEGRDLLVYVEGTIPQ